jgi:hypothetical protein
MCLSEAIGGYTKGVAEKSTDTAVPCMDPRENARGSSELLGQLHDMCEDIFLVDDPIS